MSTRFYPRFMLVILIVILCVALFTSSFPAVSQTAPTRTPNPTEAFQTAVGEALMLTATARAVSATAIAGSEATPDPETNCVDGEQLPPDAELLYGFEETALGEADHHWGTSEQDYKPDVLTVTDEVAHCGNQSLALTTQLDATGDDIYRHTEATAYFDVAIPENRDTRGAYDDFIDHTISCFVYVPTDFPHNTHDVASIQIFVKDRYFQNLYGEAVDIGANFVGGWLQLRLSIHTQTSGGQTTFDARRVNTLGIRILVPSNSDLDDTVTLYIDDCWLQSNASLSATPTTP